ncbi:MAG TPA: AAA family ATPase [Phycisphaerae bacterium]|nr:AAA family ATPase [Phycisphaerae bacterium]
MIETLEIHGYRCFQSFRMSGLARVNLLVGRNNCGKTALLEAMELWVTGGARFYVPLLRRGESFPEDPNLPEGELEYDVRQLFHGREITTNAELEVAARSRAGPERKVCLQVTESSRPGPDRVMGDEASDADDAAEPPTLLVRRNGPALDRAIGLTARFGWRPQAGSVPEPGPTGGQRFAYLFLSTGPWSGRVASDMWGRIALTDDEDRILDALHLLDSGIEKVRFVGTHPRDLRREARGFAVKHASFRPPVPIGSLGDGIWRVFVLATALVSAKGSLVLVDEIDTGLHHTVMRDVWRIALKTAERLGAQVFATTHSLDCISALAEICEDAPQGSIALHRIELGKAEAVTYPQEDIPTAVRHGIETR